MATIAYKSIGLAAACSSLATWVAASKPSAHAAAVKVTAAAPPPSSMPAAYASTLDRPSSASEKALIGSKTAVQAFRGGIVHSLALGKLEVLEDGLLTVGPRGEVLELVDLNTCADSEERVAAVSKVLNTLSPAEVLVPGFVDGHAHAPQYAFLGTGMDLPLLQWLETYTFPVESQFKDLAYARKVYNAAVARGLKSGTTTCSWFATIHLQATKLLVDIVREQGQRAHVGKVSMDRNSPPNYVEDSASAALRDVNAFIEYVHSSEEAQSGNKCLGPEPLVTPSIIPRFVPTCSSELMHGLGHLSRTKGRAAKNGNEDKQGEERLLPVHSHLSESPAEIAWVKELHPDAATYADVYKNHGLLHERSYMAHCVHCGSAEQSVLHSTKCGVVHCASSNFMLKSGVLDVRPLLDKGIKVALGTDIAGGYSPSMLDALRQAILASRAVSFAAPSWAPVEALTYAEAFHLATVGGAEVLGLDHLCGNFKPGKQLDALVVDLAAANGPVDLLGLKPEGALERFEKFIFCGDDRSIKAVYVDGKRVSGTGMMAENDLAIKK